MKPSIMLYNGREFDLTNPDLTGFTIEDAARVMSRLLRFVAHAHADVPLTDHSVFVYKVALYRNYNPLLCFGALMHDVHEIFCGGNSAPFKMLVPQIKQYEKIFHATVLRHFSRESGVTLTEDQIEHLISAPLIKDVDSLALDVERILFMSHGDWWPEMQSAKDWLQDSMRNGVRRYFGPNDDETAVRSYASVMARRAQRFLVAYANAVADLQRYLGRHP